MPGGRWPPQATVSSPGAATISLRLIAPARGYGRQSSHPAQTSSASPEMLSHCTSVYRDDTAVPPVPWTSAVSGNLCLFRRPGTPLAALLVLAARQEWRVVLAPFESAPLPRRNEARA